MEAVGVLLGDLDPAHVPGPGPLAGRRPVSWYISPSLSPYVSTNRGFPDLTRPIKELTFSGSLGRLLITFWTAAAALSLDGLGPASMSCCGSQWLKSSGSDFMTNCPGAGSVGALHYH